MAVTVADTENNNYTYRNQVNAAIGQLRLALETNDMGGACASTQWRVAEHGQCDRAARPVQRGRHATAPTRTGTAHPDYHGDNA